MLLPLRIFNGVVSWSTSLSPVVPLTSLASNPSIFPFLSKVAAPALLTCSSRVQVAYGSCELQSHDDVNLNSDKKPPITRESAGDSVKVLNGNENSGGISGIRVPRPRYISISKARLLDAIISELFDSQVEANQFVHLCKCLDSILLAEHKCILEDMRVDYDLTSSVESEETVYKSSFNPERKFDLKGKQSYALESKEECEVDGIDLRKIDFSAEIDSLLASFSINAKKTAPKRVAVHTRFQRAFVQLLYNAEFEELSVRDLLLTYSLNTDYLLTLPIYIDWRRASQSNTIIYRRGYATERQQGLLTGEKLDYLQSMLLQRIFSLISRPLKKLGMLLTEVLKRSKQIRDAEIWTENLKLWLKKLPFLQQTYSYDVLESDNLLEADHAVSVDLPIWSAAQRAVARYEGILSTVGPRFTLLRRLLTWIGLAPSNTGQALDLMTGAIGCDSESYSRPIFLSRISLGDVWQPASLKYCGGNFWKMLKTAISIFVSQSTLQEPAFKELILLYTNDIDRTNDEVEAEVPPLQLKIYEKIPIPDLPVIFPHKKLSFRILDTVRLDVATIFGLLAYFINYKFEDILSSPSAILLDVIAVSALIIYVFRVVLGYKQTWDRYQLLVNRTLYEKTIASGFGSVHFLLDASQQQQYKEAILAYAILLKAETCQNAFGTHVGDKCEKFIYEVFNEKIEMPIDKAKDTLLRLGFVTTTAVGEEYELQAISCSRAVELLRQKWNSLLA